MPLNHVNKVARSKSLLSHSTTEASVGLYENFSDRMLQPNSLRHLCLVDWSIEAKKTLEEKIVKITNKRKNKYFFLS